MENCIAAIGSVTHAMKVQQVLSNNYIYSKIVKLDSTMTKKGCSYGLNFPCNKKHQTKRIIENLGFIYEEYKSR